MRFTWANISERRILVSNFGVTRNSLCEFHTLDWLRHVCALPENSLSSSQKDTFIHVTSVAHTYEVAERCFGGFACCWAQRRNVGRGLEKASVTGYRACAHCFTHLRERGAGNLGQRRRVARREQEGETDRTSFWSWALHTGRRNHPWHAVMEQQVCGGMEAFNTRLREMDRRTMALEGERQALIYEVIHLWEEWILPESKTPQLLEAQGFIALAFSTWKKRFRTEYR